MKLAYFSPLGPQRSGIADYSEELLPHLAKDAEIDLFVDGFSPSNEELRSRFRIFDYKRDPSLLDSLGSYDAAVYHLGNDHRYHSEIYEVAMGHPGVVVFHDFALQDFFLGLARERGDLNLYLDELEAAHGNDARREAEDALATGRAPACAARPTEFPLNLRLARAARAIVVHSEWSRRRFQKVVPETPVAHVPMPVRLPAEEPRAETHAGGPLVVANFGLITPGKGIERALRVLSRLRGEYDFRYLLVGETNPFYDVHALVRTYDMEDRVHITGHVTLAEFERHMTHADVALNIRERTVGETSASLCRIMAAGLPAVVADAGWYAELPDSCVLKLDLDETGDALLEAYLRRLFDDAPLRARIAENARRYAHSQHTLERAAENYLAFIRQLSSDAPADDITLPSHDLTPTAQNIRTAAQNLRTPAQNLTSPAQNLRTPAQNLSTPAQNLTTPAQNLTSTAQNLTSAAQNLTPTAQTLSRQSDDVSSTAQNLSAAAQTIPAPAPAPSVAAPRASDAVTPQRSGRLRLAYFSPLNPQASGISDYSEELLPHLAKDAEIDLFVDGFSPSNDELRAHFRIFDYKHDDPSLLDSLGSYDTAVYHLGNDHRYHSGIYEVAMGHPGVVVFHDFALQDFFLGLARERGDLNLYLDELEAAHGVRERRLAAEAFAHGASPAHLAAPLSFPLNLRLARAAEGLITHSRAASARLRELAPGTPVAHVNHHIDARAASRPSLHDARAGDTVRLASFGNVTADKGLERVLRALALLRDELDFRYTLVGALDYSFDARGLIHELGLDDRVQITGRVTLAEFERRIDETDFAVNLRTRTSGEASGSLCRLMAAGVPALVSNTGWFAELPDDAVVKLDAGEWLDAELPAYLRRLITDAPLRERVGAAARRHVLAEHRIEQSAARYLSLIAETVDGRARRRFVGGVSKEVSRLGIDPRADSALLQTLATEVAALAPSAAAAGSGKNDDGETGRRGDEGTGRQDDGAIRSDLAPSPRLPVSPSPPAPGRLPKVEGVDYKRAAVEYPSKLDAERHHYLYTKPFYNLANKPPKHLGEGMDPETHRHFCDFANVAVALALPAGRRLLDVGCGSGWLSEYFARLGYEVTGIDISPDLIEIAQQRTACVPYDVDHETPVLCRFLVHDVEASPLEEKFDAVICYDSLHHFEDERAVMRHLSEMVDYGGLLFILEGGKPDAGSETEAELIDVMRQYDTLESPFDPAYLRALVAAHGFLVVGDYVSVNGLYDRESVEAGDRVQFTPEDVNYLLCKKVTRTVAPAESVATSRAPNRLAARITTSAELPATLAPGAQIDLPLTIENTGDTLWLTGPATRRGAVMLGLLILDETERVVAERHGEPPLPSPLAPGESVRLALALRAPRAPGRYRLKLDLVAQHVAWFEQHGSEPLVLEFEVK